MLLDILFVFIIGFLIGSLSIFISYGLFFRKKKYGFDSKISFDYENHIKREILDFDKEQHSNK